MGSAVPWMTRVGAAIERQGPASRARPAAARRGSAPPRSCGRARCPGAPGLGSSSSCERALAAREDARIVDEVIGHRVGIGPVHARVRHELPELLGRWWELAVGGRRGRGADEDEGKNAFGVVEPEELRERAAGRDADQVRRRNVVGIEHAGRVGDEIGAGVSGPPGLVGDRAAGVAVVVTDDEPPAIGERPAEVLLPPEHGGADARDEEDRGSVRVTERLGAELDPVRVDHALGHPGSVAAWLPGGASAGPLRSRWTGRCGTWFCVIAPSAGGGPVMCGRPRRRRSTSSSSPRSAGFGGSTARTAFMTRGGGSAASAGRRCSGRSRGPTVSIAAGCLDAPTGIRTVEQIWVESAGDYYDVDQ